MVNFDSSDNIKITLDPSAAKFDYLDGYLGTKTFDININDLDVSQLAKLGKGIRMENPIMDIYVDNSFGVPILVRLVITSKDDKNNTCRISERFFRFRRLQIRPCWRNLLVFQCGRCSR